MVLQPCALSVVCAGAGGIAGSWHRRQMAYEAERISEAIMFTGALDNMVRMIVERLFRVRRARPTVSPPGPQVHPPGRDAAPASTTTPAE